MNGRAFFDTNILLYIHSSADPGKQAAALALFREYAPHSRMLLSTQVIQEFFVAATRKLLLPAPYVREITLTLLDSPLITVAPAHIRTAIDHADRYRISFWDALILAAAETGGAEVLYTEDLNDGQQYGTVRACNPFRSANQ